MGRFASYDALRVFDVAARCLSFTGAANELNLTKGAISYQIGKLESELGFDLFERRHRCVALTEKGRRLWHASHVAFRDLDREIALLREDTGAHITIGLTTYFASRWLSPRLMTFIADHPDIALRLQPSVDLSDLPAERIDMAIRWGRGQWSDMVIERLLSCPAFATAGAGIAARIADEGIEAVLSDVLLLHDRDGSTAWQEWHMAAGLTFNAATDTLVVPDPNVRVQAVIDGQGVALNDVLVAAELSAGTLVAISDVRLDDYGYFLAYPEHALDDPSLRAFRDWIVAEATSA